MQQHAKVTWHQVVTWHEKLLCNRQTTHGKGSLHVLHCAGLQLTRLLEDSLGGSSKTLLVVNCRCERLQSLWLAGCGEEVFTGLVWPTQ